MLTAGAGTTTGVIASPGGTMGRDEVREAEQDCLPERCGPRWQQVQVEFLDGGFGDGKVYTLQPFVVPPIAIHNKQC